MSLPKKLIKLRWVPQAMQPPPLWRTLLERHFSFMLPCDPLRVHKHGQLGSLFLNMSHKLRYPKSRKRVHHGRVGRQNEHRSSIIREETNHMVYMVYNYVYTYMCVCVLSPSDPWIPWTKRRFEMTRETRDLSILARRDTAGAGAGGAVAALTGAALRLPNKRLRCTLTCLP